MCLVEVVCIQERCIVDAVDTIAYRGRYCAFLFRLNPEASSGECLRLGEAVCIYYRCMVDAADTTAYRG